MRDVIPLFVNFDNDPQNVCGRFQATKRPTIILADQEGKSIQKFEGDIPGLQPVVAEFAKKYFRDFPWAESLDKAVESAKKDKKLVGFFFADESDGSRQFVKTLKDAGLKSFVSKIDFVKFAFKKDSDDAKKYKISKAVTLLLWDAERGEEVDRVEGKKTVKELKGLFEKHLK